MAGAASYTTTNPAELGLARDLRDVAIHQAFDYNILNDFLYYRERHNGYKLELINIIPKRSGYYFNFDISDYNHVILHHHYPYNFHISLHPDPLLRTGRPGDSQTHIDCFGRKLTFNYTLKKNKIYVDYTSSVTDFADYVAYEMFRKERVDEKDFSRWLHSIIDRDIPNMLEYVLNTYLIKFPEPVMYEEDDYGNPLRRKLSTVKGGAIKDKYYLKYLKYKQKYLALKNKK